eukprot:13079487-Alexandrium_andersonii.AAC.1
MNFTKNWRVVFKQLSQVKPTTYPNNTVAKIEKKPTLHMDEVAVPEGPTERNVLVQGLEKAENGVPSSCGSGGRA